MYGICQPHGNFLAGSSAFMTRLNKRCPALDLPLRGLRYPGVDNHSTPLFNSVSPTVILEALANDKARAIYVPGKIEQATRQRWAKSGLRISPFDLQQGIGRM